ncbi:hypothetical protein BTUL_0219g00080 [Botrytis tulipae]|uniref:Uncharacterized protein n=1 Tax=Botrytis tulipae TaxID=87230 RepID=A0A4Z1EAK8_9HELO|nr:hypothetical protein BTUL_0219g00080 [Botrytis tulipae]
MGGKVIRGLLANSSWGSDYSSSTTSLRAEVCFASKHVTSRSPLRNIIVLKGFALKLHLNSDEIFEIYMY